MTPPDRSRSAPRCFGNPADGDSPKATGLPRNAEARQVLLEGLLVAVIGALGALVANEISPRGLALGRDYFPGAVRRSQPTSLAGNLTARTVGTNAPSVSPGAGVSERLQAKGLHLVDSNQVAALFRDPRYEQELVVFVDARDDRHYQEGHVPGAYQLDHYRAENFLPIVLPVCQTADQIVVYCNGGDCEDSEFAATTLSEAGTPKTRLLIYGGGMAEWATNGMPVEIGPRGSGVMRGTSK